MCKLLVGASAAAALVAAQPAAAAVITSLSDGQTHTMPVFNIFGVLPNGLTYGDGGFVTITASDSTGGALTAAYGAAFDFGWSNSSDPSWSGEPAYTAFGLSTGVLSISFASPVSSALARWNWESHTAPTLRAFNGQGQLLESAVLSGSGQQAGYWGFARAQAEISRIEMSGFQIGARDVSTYVAPPTGAVPEPGAWALMIAGFGLAGSALRRTRRRTQPA